MLQAVSYEFQAKQGAWLSQKSWRRVLAVSGLLAPLLIGMAVGTFFNGAAFTVDKSAIGALPGTDFSPVISRWANASCGLDALLDVFNLLLGIAVLFLARVLGLLYMVNNISDDVLQKRMRRSLVWNAGLFLVFFLAFFIHVLLKDGFAYDASTGVVFMAELKYLHNLLEQPSVLVLLLLGVVLLLTGIVRTVLSSHFNKGIWWSGIGTVLAVTALFLMAGWNDTAYYPSNADLQSSLTIANSCSSEFTLSTMAVVSLLVPFVLAYIYYAWRSIDSKKIDRDELKSGDIY